MALGADDCAFRYGGLQAVQPVHYLELFEVLGGEDAHVGDVREEEFAVGGGDAADGLDVADVGILFLGLHQLVEDGFICALGAEEVKGLGEILRVQGPAAEDVGHTKAGEFPSLDEGVEAVQGGGLAEHPRESLVVVVSGRLEILGEIDVADEAEAAFRLEGDTVDAGLAGLQISLQHRLEFTVAGADLECGDLVNEDGIVPLEVSELLGGPVIEHTGTGGASAAEQPDVFAEVGVHERLAGSLGSQFNHIEAGLYEDDKTGDELQFHLESLRSSVIAEAVRVILHCGDNEVYPLFGGEF